MFLYNAMALVQSNTENAHSERSTDRYIDKLLTNLNNYAYVPLKVSQIYKEFPLAQSTLINSFRKRTGYTIIQYLGIKKWSMPPKCCVTPKIMSPILPRQ